MPRKNLRLLSRLVITPILIATIFSLPVASPSARSRNNPVPYVAPIIANLRLVNDYWINSHLDPGDNGWARATYFEGNMAMYQVYPKAKYLRYAVGWANKHNWGLIGGTSTRNADNQCAGQIYIDLYRIEGNPLRIADIAMSIRNMVNSPKIDDWYWIDALQMAMPVFAKLSVLYNDTAYLDKMYELYYDTKIRRELYNAESGLWYRDKNYLPPRVTTNGKPISWSRGNGWVFAAHVRILQELPLDDPHRNEYIATFQTMAAALKKVQREDGFWNVNLGDPDDYGGPETSGTAFFTYGMAWGINNGFLEREQYETVVIKAWNGMVKTAVHQDGFLGYVQGAGYEPASSQPVTFDTTSDFGVGAFLLAGSEVSKLLSHTLGVPDALK